MAVPCSHRASESPGDPLRKMCSENTWGTMFVCSLVLWSSCTLRSVPFGGRRAGSARGVTGCELGCGFQPPGWDSSKQFN